MKITDNNKFIHLAIILLSFALLLSSTQAAEYSDPGISWYTSESEHFVTHYHEGLEQVSKEAIAIAEASHQQLSQYFNWRPSGKTQMILTDRVDYSNGMAMLLERNTMVIHIAPPDDLDSLSDHASWLELVIFHEYTHILHLDMVSGFPEVMRTLFGRVPLLGVLPNPFFFPQFASPHWMKEGLATWVETSAQRGVGRGQSSYFEMMMRTEVQHGVQPVRQVNQLHGSWPSGQTAYLYGYYFYEFVAQQYGEEKVRELIWEYSDNFLPFFINHNSKQVLSKSYPQLWREFTLWLHKKFQPQIERLESEGLIEGTRITHNGFISDFPLQHDKAVYYVRADGGSRPALMRLGGNGEDEKLLELNGQVRFDINDAGDIALVMLEQQANVEIFYDVYLLPKGENKLRRISTGARYHDVEWHPDGQTLIATSYQAGNFSLHRLSANGESQNLLWQGASHIVISNPVVAPDGNSIVASLWQPDGGWNLQRFDMQQKTWERLTHGKEIENHPIFDQSGETLYYAADSNGVFNIHSLDIASGEIRRITNVKTGAFAPSVANGVLVYAGYHVDGFDLYRMPLSDEKRFPLLTFKEQTSGETRVFEDVPIDPAKPYEGLRLVKPTWWTVLYGAGSSGNKLWRLNSGGGDPLEHHNYRVTLEHDSRYPSDFFGALSYVNQRWLPSFYVDVGRELYTLYDGTLDGNPGVYALSDNRYISLGMQLPLVKIRRAWLLDVSGTYQQADYLDSISNEAQAYPDFMAVAAGVIYDNTYKGRLSDHPIDGRRYELAYEQHVTSDGFGGGAIRLDLREYVELGRRNSLAFHALGVYGFDGAAPSYLGGVLNDDTTTSSWGDEFYNLRGYPDAYLGGYRIGKFSAEWRFPIKLVERGIMAPPVALDRLSGSLFVDTGVVMDDIALTPSSLYHNTIRSAGAEFLVDTIWGYYLPVRFRYGIAARLEKEIKFYTYLGVLSSF